MIKKIFSLFSLFLLLGITFSATHASEATGTLNTGIETGLNGVVVTAPTISPAGGSYTAATLVTLTAPGATGICYTTDGNNPVCSASNACGTGTLYTGAINLAASATVKGISCYPGNGGTLLQSSLSSAIFTITISSPPGGGSPGGGGGGSTPSSDSKSNTTTSTIYSNLTSTVTQDATYSRPLQLADSMITTDSAGNKSAQLTGEDGSIILKPNSLSTISISIPENTTVTGTSAWNGAILPPMLFAVDTVTANDIWNGQPLVEENVGAVVKIGSLTSPLTFSNPVTITIPVNLPDGTVVQVLWSSDNNNWTAEATTTVKNGKVIFTTTHLSYFAVYKTGEAQPEVKPVKKGPKVLFTDISRHWGKTYIELIAKMGIVNGKTPTRFAPDDKVLRAELAKIAVNAFKIPLSAKVTAKPFADVAIKDWYAPYTLAARNAGIIKIKSTARFLPAQPATRAETLQMFLDAAKVKLTAPTANVFPDVSKKAWYAPYVAYAKEKGIVIGYTDGKFHPEGQVTRAEAVKILVKIMGLE